MHKKFGKEGWGSIKIFRRIFFCLTVPKKFVGVPFSVSLISGPEKVQIRERREYQDFPSKFFCLTVPKNFIVEPFSVSLNSVTEKIWIRGRGTQDLTSKISCLTVPIF